MDVSSSSNEQSRFTSVNIPLLDEGDPNSFNGAPNSQEPKYPIEKFRTLVSLLYLLFGFVFSVSMLQFVHERVPSMETCPPLPDVAFDLVPRRVEWAFDVCEINGMVLVGICLLILFLHKHRWIIARRVFFILGTLYVYRTITMLVTTLPVPGLHFHCAPKVSYGSVVAKFLSVGFIMTLPSVNQVHGKIGMMAYRAVMLLMGGGLSVTGAHNLCGDYLFSGHTIILVITYLSIKEYTPVALWPLHWLSWALAASGVVGILLAHDHYTVDIVVAYLFATRLFWTYHTMASSSILKMQSKSNLWSRVWWFCIFKYLEENIRCNGNLPPDYEWPLPWPRHLRHKVIRRSPVKGI